VVTADEAGPGDEWVARAVSSNEAASIAVQVESLRKRQDQDERALDELRQEWDRRRSWYSDIATWIAGLALVVSALGFSESRRDIQSDRERQDQQRLDQLVQELPGLRGEDSVDRRVLVTEAATTLMDTTPSSPSQKVEVATAWQSLGNLEAARDLLLEATDQATAAYERSVTQRVLANVHFELGSFNAGRSAYKRVIDLQQSEYSPSVRGAFLARDHMRWARDELYGANDCRAAREQVDEARAKIGALRAAVRSPLSAELSAIEKDLAAGCK
jgi:tetratricopeptide (TPR) repeat protein